MAKTAQDIRLEIISKVLSLKSTDLERMLIYIKGLETKKRVTFEREER